MSNECGFLSDDFDELMVILVYSRDVLLSFHLVELVGFFLHFLHIHSVVVQEESWVLCKTTECVLDRWWLTPELHVIPKQFVQKTFFCHFCNNFLDKLARTALEFGLQVILSQLKYAELCMTVICIDGLALSAVTCPILSWSIFHTAFLSSAVRN